MTHIHAVVGAVVQVLGRPGYWRLVRIDDGVVVFEPFAPSDAHLQSAYPVCDTETPKP